MSVASTVSIEKTIRTRLLTFVPSGGGATIATTLGNTGTGAGSDGKLYLNQPPDNITGFYGTMRLLDMPQQGLDGGFMVRGVIELILYGRPRKTQSDVERMADVATEAWQDWSYTEAGGRCIVARDVTHRSVIPYAEPADRELVAVRLLLPFMATPTALT